MKQSPLQPAWTTYDHCDECGVDAREPCQNMDNERAETPCEGRPLVAVRPRGRPRKERPPHEPQRKGPAPQVLCIRGHDLATNTYARPLGKGRQCKRCNTEGAARRRAAKKAEMNNKKEST